MLVFFWKWVSVKRMKSYRLGKNICRSKAYYLEHIKNSGNSRVKLTNPTRKRAKDMKRHSTDEDIMIEKHLKDASHRTISPHTYPNS
jgi:hypothetical protein